VAFFGSQADAVSYDPSHVKCDSSHIISNIQLLNSEIVSAYLKHI